MIPVIGVASNTQKEIDRTEQEKGELEGKLDDTQQGLSQIKGERNTLKGELNNLNVQLEAISEKLADLEEKIGFKGLEILDTQAALEEARVAEAEQYEDMVRRACFSYENDTAGYFDFLFNSVNIAELLNMGEYLSAIDEYDQKLLREYGESRQLIEEWEYRLHREQEDLEGMRIDAEATKSKVIGLIGQASQAISKFDGQISDVESQITAYEAAIKKKEEDLEYLQKKLAEEIAMSKRAANAVWRNISDVRFEEGDRYLLANIIYCEAGGEPYDGQLAVGAVVINRVLSSVYPDTVVGVIYQSGQFSPVGSGRLSLALAENRATAGCYRAADQAMAGDTNVGNCVFFRTPVPGLNGLNIGGHVFY
jgi:peptidoglycan hydrolase CwlO-like protein